MENHSFHGGEALNGQTDFLLKLAIDFGSTNTVMAWRILERDGGGVLRLSDRYNQINNVRKVPTVMIFRDDNPGNESVKRDCCGSEAEAVIRDSNFPPVVCDNFKQKLYTAPGGSEEYREGRRLAEKFFCFLREIYREEVYNRLPSHVLRSMKGVLYLSTPVRADPTHRSLMREIALEAGFTPDNGIHEISTACDEALCVVKYAMETARERVSELLIQAALPEGATALFVDVGGSTMDMVLESLHTQDGELSIAPIAWWPGADVRYPLGGCLIDEAIRDYLIGNGYADPDFAMRKWEQGDGKFRFRIFKEENNRRLAQGLPIEKLGMLRSVCYDADEEILPRQFYNKSGRWIDAEVYEKEICRDYLEHMREAMARLFDQQRAVEGRPAVTPDQVDAIFLSGAGSSLYFIPKVLLGEFGDHLCFSKIRENPDRLFDHWADPSRCCALGALMEDEKIELPNYSKDEYSVRVSLYQHDNALLLKHFTAEPQDLKPELQTVALGPDDVGSKAAIRCLFSETIPLSDKYEALPVKRENRKTCRYTDAGTDDFFLLEVQLIRRREDGSQVEIGAPCLRQSRRNLGNRMVRNVKAAAITPVLLLTLTADHVAEHFGYSPDLEKKLDKAADRLFPERTVELTTTLSMTLSETNLFSVEMELTSPFFQMDQQQFKLEL